MGSYNQQVKLAARELYVAGEPIEAICAKLGERLGKEIKYSVIHSWKQSGILGGDWDEAREESLRRVQAEVRGKLEKARADIASVHFDDLELLRKIWKNQLFQKDPDRPGQVLRNEDNAPIPRQFKPGEHRALAQAYAVIMGGLRTVLGQDAYSVGFVDKSPKKGVLVATEFYDDLPKELVASIEGMLSANFANPGEKLEDEEEAERAAQSGAVGAASAALEADEQAAGVDGAVEPTADGGLPEDEWSEDEGEGDE